MTLKSQPGGWILSRKPDLCIARSAEPVTTSRRVGQAQQARAVGRLDILRSGTVGIPVGLRPDTLITGHDFSAGRRRA
jgi:hypothetical protein